MRMNQICLYLMIFLEADDSIVELPEWDDLLEGTPLLDSFLDCDDSLSEPWLDSSPLDVLCSDEDVGPAELLDSLVDFSWLDEVIGDDSDDCFPDDFSAELACDLDSELVSLLTGVEGENESDLLVPDDFLEADDSIVELPE